MNTLQQKIESLLFYKNEPVSYLWLAKMLDVEKQELMIALSSMEDFYTDRGMMLVDNGESVSLMTHSDCQSLLQSIQRNDEEKELSKQALETLAIIMYRSGVTKSEIDYIRGVNSVFILRNLSSRGLIMKKENPDDRRAPLYVPTHESLAFLGIDEVSKLPDYERFVKEIEVMREEHVQESQAE